MIGVNKGVRGGMGRRRGVEVVPVLIERRWAREVRRWAA
jgi:hypothetical protein